MNNTNIIDKSFSFLLKKPALLSIGGLFLLFFIISLYNRFLGSDECWFGEQSYWLLHDGFVRIESMRGILGFSEHCYVYHKLFIFMGSGIIALFGWSVTYFRISTLVFGAIFSMFLLKYLGKNSSLYNANHQYVAIFLFFVNPMIALKVFEFRPEIMLMALGFISFYFIDNYKKQSNKLIWPLWGGIFSGLAFLTNMNGVAFCVTGFFFLLLSRKYKGLLVYTLASFAVISLFFFDLLKAEAWNTFVYQLTHGVNSFVNEDIIGDRSIWQFILDKLIRLTKEHERFFWSEKTMFFSLLFVLALVSRFKFLIKKHGSVLLYLILLIVSNNIFGSHIAERYIISYYPFMILIITVFLVDILEQKNPLIKTLAFTIIILQIVFAFVFTAKIISKNHDFAAEHELVFEKINNKDANILGPWDLIYNGMGSQNLYSFKTYEYLDQIEGKKMTQEEFLKKAIEFDMDFIVLPENMKYDGLKSWFADWKIDPNPYFEEFYSDEDFKILKRKETPQNSFPEKEIKTFAKDDNEEGE